MTENFITSRKEDKGDLIEVTKDINDSIMALFAMKSK